MNDPDSLDEKLEKFECLRCNECCRQPGFVYLRPGEPEAMAAFLKMDERQFLDEFCELQDRRQLVLKKNPDESCVFLNDSGCRVHPVKPGQCLDFPRKWRTPKSLEYCQGIRKILP